MSAPPDLPERICGFAFRAAFTVIMLTAVTQPDVWAADEKKAVGPPLVRVKFTNKKNRLKTGEGRILIEAQDGGILLLGRDGALTNVTPKRLKSRKETGGPFQPFSAGELGKQLQKEFGKGFHIHTTKHYVVCSDAGVGYSKWCGAMFEQLMRSFRAYWKTGPKLHDPQFRLTAIVFRKRADFARYATDEFGPSFAQALGYYSINRNRIVLFDMTGGAGGRTAREINNNIRKAGFNAANVATVIHEATHQVAYNTGMHVGYADNPLWLTEGMAMYFETLKLGNRTGGRTLGQVNPFRLKQFRDYVARRRKPDAIEALISTSKRFTDTTTLDDAYAESWALSYFLIRTRKKEYRKYLSGLAMKPRLNWDSPETRLAEFKTAFGNDLRELDRKFLKYMKTRR